MMAVLDARIEEGADLVPKTLKLQMVIFGVSEVVPWLPSDSEDLKG